MTNFRVVHSLALHWHMWLKVSIVEPDVKGPIQMLGSNNARKTNTSTLPAGKHLVPNL
jgi:hypothetical protein